MKFKGIIFLLSILLVQACKKEEASDTSNSPPLISIAALSADSVVEFQDALFITLNYEDLQGNLGNANPDMLDLEVKDSRLATPDMYHVKPLAPEGYRLHIKGSLSIKVNTLFLLGTGNTETTRFTIRLRDRDGLWSEPAETPIVTIVRQ